ncbi:SDR family NAD(P)-dependent oxidoreductase [Oceanicola sp. S124]|uniref:SDR family NAD(P)-dependent oxidoreductase n=1 Tax=Oceanicola sp. S124 TaxID=1042378 RepID=UPI0002557D28|nr:SDR family NAD(P)-dependent oxidoreductase [Oceanicola sp. S124]
MSRDLLRLSGKVALITGGAAGIGRATAELYLEAGMQVVIADNHADRCAEASAAMPAALVIEADVRDPDDVARIIDETRQRFGRLDVLVNNVGDYLKIFTPFERSTEEEWEALYDINLKHMFRMTRAALPLVKASGEGGSIINLSTVEALRGIPNATVYSAFNSAILGFTRSLSVELGYHGIRVNAIAPETTDTIQVTADPRVPLANRPHIRTWFPMGRFGRGEDSAGAALYLASERLSGWVTGTTMVVDGGVIAAGAWMRMQDGTSFTHLPIIAADGYTDLD